MVEIRNKIFQGNSLDVLKTLPSESINMCVTSPPYWALRDYGTEGQIWDGKEGCNHEFGIMETPINRMMGMNERIQKEANNEKSKFVGNEQMESKSVLSGVCKKCGAWKGELGLEPTFKLYIKHLCDIFDEVKRVLRPDGTCWVNLGDTYYSVSGGKFLNDNISNADLNLQKGISQANALKSGKELQQKSLCMIPERFAIEMMDRGWILRNQIIWKKRNCMPTSVRDRFTVDFEKIFFFAKQKKYFFETQREPHKVESIKRACRGRTSEKLDAGQYSTSYKNDYVGYDDIEGKLERGELRGVHAEGRNKRCVWDITTKGFSGAHFAVYPEKLIETPLKAGCPKQICKKCGKPRVKEYKINNLTEGDKAELIKKDEPYAVQHREGTILVRDLPKEEKIIEYLREWKKNITYKQISDFTGLAVTSVTHWFTDVDTTHGFSYPTKKEWIKLKELLKFDDTYDDAMTKEYVKPAGVMDNEYKFVGYSNCGCNAGWDKGIVLDPFFGAGTTGVVAKKQDKDFVGVDMNPEYIKIADKRLDPYLKQKSLNDFGVNPYE